MLFRPFQGHKLAPDAFHEVMAHCSPSPFCCHPPSSSPDCTTSCTPRAINQLPSNPLAHPLLSLSLTRLLLGRRAFHSLFNISLVRTLSIRDILCNVGVRNDYAIIPPASSPLPYLSILVRLSVNSLHTYSSFLQLQLSAHLSLPPPTSSPIAWSTTWAGFPSLTPFTDISSEYRTPCTTTSISKYRSSTLEFILNTPPRLLCVACRVNGQYFLNLDEPAGAAFRRVDDVGSEGT